MCERGSSYRYDREESRDSLADLDDMTTLQHDTHFPTQHPPTPDPNHLTILMLKSNQVGVSCSYYKYANRPTCPSRCWKGVVEGKARKQAVIVHLNSIQTKIKELREQKMKIR